MTEPTNPLVLAAEDALRALEPFASVAKLMQPLVAMEPERWPDDKPNHSFTPSEWPRWGDFKAALAAASALRQALENRNA